uniref:Uncharacterized protein n=1 Tax=Rhodnius prolixus TaxID=13249 RepID=T1HBI3_RHOPR
MGVNTPLIVVFYSYHLIMVVISMLISVITYNLHQSSSPVPWYIASILRGPLASVLGVQNKKMHYDEEMTGTGEELRQYEDNQGDRRLLTGSGIRQWTLVAKAVDRAPKNVSQKLDLYEFERFMSSKCTLPRGRPRLKWLRHDVEAVGLHGWRTAARDREGWKAVVAEVQALHGL